MHPMVPDPRRFDGPPGTVRVHVEVNGTDPFPQEWRLVIEPSRTSVGAEHAVRRVIEIDDGRQDVEVTDLPLAGYDVRAEAEGMNGYPVGILLERGPASEAGVNLHLIPAGHLEGFLADETGNPVDELLLTLESLPTGHKQTATSDLAGRFLFPEVLEGQYRLHYGHPNSPVLKAKLLRVPASGMSLPPVTLPVLCGVHVLVLGEDGLGVEGAQVLGTGTEGGHIEGKTDVYGLLMVRHLPAGRYRIRAEHADHGSRRATFDLETGDLKEITVKFQ